MLRTTSSAVATFARRQPPPKVNVAIAALPSSSPPSDCGCGNGRACPSSSSSGTSPATAVVLPPRLLHQVRSMTILSKESKAEFKKENYSSRMSAKGQPVSPHVAIYAFPVCALSSITTRITGCALSFGSAGLGVVEILGGNGAALDLMSTLGGANVALACSAKFAVSFPLIYHALGGMRHLIWDSRPEMLSNVDVERASYILVGTSLVLSGAAVFA
jgi:succinate dehydrogenase (ubiquinone) cytochrome b560 subunit